MFINKTEIISHLKSVFIHKIKQITQKKPHFYTAAVMLCSIVLIYGRICVAAMWRERERAAEEDWQRMRAGERKGNKKDKDRESPLTHL